MFKSTKLAAFGLTGAIVLAMAGSVQASQNSKNDWRNLTAVGAVVTGLGLLSHNSTATILGAAGAAYSANRFEQDRKNQRYDNGRWSYNNRRYDTHHDYAQGNEYNRLYRSNSQNYSCHDQRHYSNNDWRDYQDQCNTNNSGHHRHHDNSRYDRRHHEHDNYGDNCQGRDDYQNDGQHCR